MSYVMWLDKDGKTIVATCTPGSRIGGTARERYLDDLAWFNQTPEETEQEYQSVLLQVNKYNEEHK